VPDLADDGTGATKPGGRVRAATIQVLQRATWRSGLQVALLVLALWFLVNALAGIDFGTVVEELGSAKWGLVAIAALVAQIPRLTQTVSTLGASPRPLPPRPIYALQLAQGYVGLAVPSSAARVAMNVRFFQKQGFSQGAALAIGALDSLAGFAVEALLLGSLLLFTPQSLHFDLDAPDLPGWGRVLAVLAIVAFVVVVISALRPSRRRQVHTWVTGLLADGRSAARGLRSPRRLVLLVGGNLASILTFSAALGLFASALGTRVSYADLVVTVISTSLLAGLLPVPGGVGVVETGLTIGLVAAGMPEEPAFAAVILYRLATFYVPPLWGYPAFRWLQRNDHL
jgi:uncharacterized membrane protein YbhN (UPF0104 family)